jgi:hypothetical protein
MDQDSHKTGISGDRLESTDSAAPLPSIEWQGNEFLIARFD